MTAESPLGDADTQVAEKFISSLTEQQFSGRNQPAAVGPLRILGQVAVDTGVRAVDFMVRPLRKLVRPWWGPGVWLAHLRLLAPGKTFEALLDGEAVGGLMAGVLSASPGTIVSTVWNTFLRVPWLVWRVRRRIRRFPEWVLSASLVVPESGRLPYERILPLMPREDFYPQLLPGVLTRGRKDVQLVVGRPGVGKTTELVLLSQLLARIGFVSVLVPMRTVPGVDILGLAHERLRRQVSGMMRSDAEFDAFWRWLARRRRLVILVDDLDQLAARGAREAALRAALDNANASNLPVVAMARPTGMPAGMAASTIQLEGLPPGLAVVAVRYGVHDDPAVRRFARRPPESLKDLIVRGQLADTPFYLEVATQLAAIPALPRLAPGQTDPLWVRFHMLDEFSRRFVDGRLRRWMGIDTRERASALAALQRAALAQLVQPGEGDGAGGLPALEDLVEVGGPLLSRHDGYGGDAKRDPRLRPEVSIHEVIDVGERLQILDRDFAGKVRFRDRTMQSYLAGCALALQAHREACGTTDPSGPRRGRVVGELLQVLLAPCHAEHVTARMALEMAVLAMESERRRAGDNAPGGEESWRAAQCLMVPGFERVCRYRGGDDDDDALAAITVAIRIGCVMPEGNAFPSGEAVRAARACRFATRWTKIPAIEALARVGTSDGWRAVCTYLGDTDVAVRRAAAGALWADSGDAFGHLREHVEDLILRAGLRSARGSRLGIPEPHADPPWTRDDIIDLEAVGPAMTAVVSGLTTEMMARAPEFEDVPMRQAREAQEQIVALGFQGNEHELELAIARGFKDDALASVSDLRRFGPGWVGASRRLVADICLPAAEHWYTRLQLHHALALYSVSSFGESETLAVLRTVASRERNPLSRRSVGLSRAAILTRGASDRWRSYVWEDELTLRRQPALGGRAGQLLADVTLLLDLMYSAPAERRMLTPYMEDLPVCLSGSPDRDEILALGCPENCGWGLCPYVPPPPDEPNARRGFGRAFCRQQQGNARRRTPPWQRRISRRALRRFWLRMELRSRT